MNNIIKGFPEAKEGDYIIWSEKHTLKRFVRIETIEKTLTCKFMFDTVALFYDQCVALVRGFDLALGYQIHPDQWEQTSFFKIEKPDIINLVSGIPDAPGRYYLYSNQQVRNAMDAKQSTIANGFYVEILDYFGQLAVITTMNPNPASLNTREDDFKNFYHFKIEI